MFFFSFKATTSRENVTHMHHFQKNIVLKEKSNILIESFIPLFPEESMGLFISLCLKIYLFMGEILLRKGEVFKRLEVALLVRFVFLLLFMAIDIISCSSGNTQINLFFLLLIPKYKYY